MKDTNLGKDDENNHTDNNNNNDEDNTQLNYIEFWSGTIKPTCPSWARTTSHY